jgi:hypothetical protein
MIQDDPLAACDRLAAMLGRAIALGERARPAADDAVRAPVLPYAIAQLRMRVRPALGPGWAAGDPVHVALFGGTNTGKSTVLNVLLGRAGAGMSARARFSQHPEAFRGSAGGDRWLDAFPSRFDGYRRYRDEHPPRQTDEQLGRDGYAPALALLDLDRLAAPALAPEAAPAAVLWDAPDFSTEMATTYLRAVLDVAALADVVVMTVTDESYADARGNLLLRMVGGSGAAVHVAANKLSDNPTLLDDLARTLSDDARGPAAVTVHRLPIVAGAGPDERLAALLGTAEAASLREAIAREASRGPELKRQALRGAVAFLRAHLDELLRPLAEEAECAARWAAAVDRITRYHLLEPYRRDYLEGVRYGEFNRTLVRVMELIQVPRIGPAIDLAGRVVRIPVRLASAAVRRLSGRSEGDAPVPPEEAVLGLAAREWLDELKAEAQAGADAGAHPAWAEVARTLGDDAFRRDLLDRFEAARAGYRKQVDDEVRRRAEAIVAELRSDPRRLNVLRGANLMTSLVLVAVAIKTAGLDWSDAVVGPAVAGLWQNLLEWGLGRYLEVQRSGLKEEQFRMLRATVEAALVRPVRDLFRGAVGGGELLAARRDFAVIEEAAARVSAEG